MVLPMTVLPVNVRIFVPPRLPDVSVAHAVRRSSSCHHPRKRMIQYFTASVYGTVLCRHKRGDYWTPAIADMARGKTVAP
jgi:hypothetical protein